jgi:ABC-type sugar transport system permease subunit
VGLDQQGVTDRPSEHAQAEVRGRTRLRTAAPRARLRIGRLTPLLYLAPMSALVGVFLLYPAADTIWTSLTDSTGINEPSFIGVDNFTRLFQDPAFATSFKNTVYWVVGVLVLQVGLGLLMALVLSATPFGRLLKGIFYVPAAISAAATGVIWYFIFTPEQGMLNSAFRLVGLGSLAQDWLVEPPLNTWAMIGAATWQGLGPAMILFLVGLQAIPRDPIEAALVDGATGWRLFWHITFPLLRPMTAVVVAISLINSFKVFDLIWVMTQGGPYRSSETLAVTMYRESFVSFHVGYGASVAVVLTAIVLVISIFYIRAMFRRVEEAY